MSAPQRSVTIDPKAAYMARKDAAKYAEFVAGDTFLAALEATIAKLALELPRAETLEQACRAHYELIGARKLIAALLNLCEPEQRESTQSRDNLLWPPPQSKPPQK